MSKVPKMRNPFTPCRRKLFLNSLMPTKALGKRLRNRGTPGDTQPVAGAKATRVALQNEDSDGNIVITALEAVPFNDHEELLQMTRSQLIETALAFNAKLPAVLQIDINISRSDTYIRNNIEFLVGLRQSTPQAPKAVKSKNLDWHASPPTSPVSPLASKGRLPVLEEDDMENEETDYESRRAKKRRSEPIDPRTSTLDGPFTRVTRSRSAQVGNVKQRYRPTTARVLRSQSQRLPGRKTDLLPFDHKGYVTTTRPRYPVQTSNKARGLQPKTSTPKRKTIRSSAPSPATPHNRLQANTSDETNAGSPVNAMTPNSGTPRVTGRDDTLGCETDDSGEMTFGIDGMTVSVSVDSGSDMDVSYS